jgi:transportin-3
MYKSDDRKKRKEATNYLEDFQKLPEAWTISDQILRSENVSEEAKIFAAQTFKKKILYDLKQLDDTTKQSLINSLFELLHIYRNGPKIIITQLCISIADLSILIKSWENPVQHLLELFSNNQEMVTSLLEFLTVLPEEILYNENIPMEISELNDRADILLGQNAENVLQLLTLYLQNSEGNFKLQENIMNCLLSWIKSNDIKVMSLLNTPFINMAFSSLRNIRLLDIAVDLIEEIIYNSSDIKENMPAIEVIYVHLVSLQEFLVQSKDDEDTVKGICRIFSEAGESYLELIVENYSAFKSIVEGLLECAASSPFEIIPITYNFWYRLQKKINEPEFNNYKPQFFDIYRNLIGIIIDRLHYPEDQNDWTSMERDEFSDFRHNMGDVLKDCCMVLGCKESLLVPYTLINNFIQESKQNPNIPWQNLEAPLFSLRAMGKVVSEDESEVMPKIMDLFPEFIDHPKIKYAAILVIGRYSFWTEKHPQYIPFQLTYVTSGFDEPEAEAAAAMSLKYICESCGVLLVDYLGQLHPFYLTMMQKLEPRDRLEVTAAISHVLSALPEDKLLENLQYFCLPLAQKLNEIAINGKVSDESEMVKITKEIKDLLAQLGVFFKNVEPKSITLNEHPCVSLLKSLWPVFEYIFTNLSDIQNISESVCRCLVHALKSCKLYIAPMLNPIAQQTVTLYNNYNYSCYLWLAKYIIDVFSEDINQFWPLLQEMVSNLCQKSFNLFSYKENLVEYPDVVEDYYRMLTKLTERCPCQFINLPEISSIYQCTIACLETEEPRALSSVLEFLENFFAVSVDTKNNKNNHNLLQLNKLPEMELQKLINILQENAKIFIPRMIKGLLYDFPREEIISIGIILKYHTYYLPDITLGLIKESLSTYQISEIEINQLIEQYHMAITEETGNSKLQRVFQDFSNSFRRTHISSRSKK